jgi:hypothetical protein
MLAFFAGAAAGLRNLGSDRPRSSSGWCIG